MTVPFSPSGRRHHQLARREMELLLKELQTTGMASPERADALDAAPVRSPEMRRFLGY